MNNEPLGETFTTSYFSKLYLDSTASEAESYCQVKFKILLFQASTMSMENGKIVKSVDGQEYQSVTLNVNGVTKRVLVPLSTNANDNFIPTPDNPLPASKDAVPIVSAKDASVPIFPGIPIAPKPRLVAPPPPLQIAPSVPTTPRVIHLDIAPTNTVPPPAVVNGGQTVRMQQVPVQITQNVVRLVPPVTLTTQNSVPLIRLPTQPTRLTTPASNVGFNIVNPSPVPINNIQVPVPNQIAVNNVGPSTVIQTGTLIRPNSSNTGSTVQYGSIAMRTPAAIQSPNVLGQAMPRTFPQQGVYRMDGSGRLQLVSSTPAPASGQSVLTNQFNRTTTTLQSLPQPKPQVQQSRQTQQPLTLSTPDGKVFTVPNHLLPATIASAITPVAQPQAATGNQLVTGSNVVRLPIPQARTGPITLEQATAAVGAVSAGNSRPVTLSTSDVSQSITQARQGSFISIAPKPKEIPLGVATILSNEPEEETVWEIPSKTSSLSVDTTDFEKKYFQQRNKDMGQKLALSPKHKHKKEDKLYRPPPNVFFSSKDAERDESRRRSSRIKTKPCSVVLKRLNIKRKATVNLNEIPVWLLD